MLNRLKYYIFLLLFFILPSQVWAADLYAKAAGGNWSAAGTWSNTSSAGGDSSGPPTAADNVIFDAGSGNVTIDAAAVARSVNCTGYTGTLTHNGGTTVTVGDATAGTGNVALKLVAGMTYTKGSNTSAQWAFISTSATQQTIASGGKVLANITINSASNGNFIQADNLAMNGATNTNFTLTKGTYSTGGYTLSVGAIVTSNTNVRAFDMTNSTISINATSGNTWSAATSTNFTPTTTGSTINLTQTGASDTTFQSGGKTFNNVVVTTGGAGKVIFAGGGTYNKLSVTGGTTKNIQFTASTTSTLTGGTDAFFSGAVSNLITISSTTGATAFTISKASGTIESDYISLQDSTATGGATFYAGANSTNVSGNTGWNFSAPPTTTTTTTTTSTTTTTTTAAPTTTTTTAAPTTTTTTAASTTTTTIVTTTTTTTTTLPGATKKNQIPHLGVAW